MQVPCDKFLESKQIEGVCKTCWFSEEAHKSSDPWLGTAFGKLPPNGGVTNSWSNGGPRNERHYEVRP